MEAKSRITSLGASQASLFNGLLGVFVSQLSDRAEGGGELASSAFDTDRGAATFDLYVIVVNGVRGRLIYGLMPYYFLW
jgi:hypothetical protein|tara:strand:+ start:19377 stop:19613 length:237 start_codon:yes stop_codon:yes gene_type:complete